MPTLTADQRRARAREAFNRRLEECPGHQVLAILSEKWTTLALEALAERPLRHGELARAIAGASQKMLTQTLRRLERDGLVTRTVTAAVPVRVDYTLTDLGRELLEVQANILRFGLARMPEIHAARDRYDTHEAVSPGD